MNSPVNQESYQMYVDLSNMILKQTIIFGTTNPVFHFSPIENGILLTTIQTEHFHKPIDDSQEDQPQRMMISSLSDSNPNRHTMANTIVGYLTADPKTSNRNILYEVNYRENYGTRSISTSAAYQGRSSQINHTTPFLIVYLDENKQIQTVGNKYIMELLPSTNMNMKFGCYLTHQKNYMTQYYGIKEDLLIHFNPTNAMEPATIPFTDMKATLINVKGLQGSAYCIRNVHPYTTVEEMRNYVNSPEFKGLYSLKSGANALSKLFGEMKSGDFTQEYDRFIFFFMKQMNLLMNFKNWIRTLANAIGVDAYISFNNKAGLNVQINVMENHSIKNMNLGVHSDYKVVNAALYPSDAEDKRKTARTILTYVDLLSHGKPVIGFTTKISGVSEKESQNTLVDYSVSEACAYYVTLTRQTRTKRRIIDEIEAKIIQIIPNGRPYFIAFIPKDTIDRRSAAYMMNKNLYLITDIDDPAYYFAKQRDILKEIEDNEYRSKLNQIHAIFQHAMESHPEITDWSFMVDNKLASRFLPSLDRCMDILTQQLNHMLVLRLKEVLTPKDARERINKDEQYMRYALFQSNLDEFMKTYCSDEDSPDARKFILDNLYDKKDHIEVLHGNACPFVDGGMVYFNGENVHTLDAGVGKRISIVYKVSYVDRTPDNPDSIEKREADYFAQFKDDRPLNVPRVTKNNIGVEPGHQPMKVTLRQQAVNVGGKRTKKRTKRNMRKTKRRNRK